MWICLVLTIPDKVTKPMIYCHCCEKTWLCHSERSEESLPGCRNYLKRKIRPNAQNDRERVFVHSDVAQLHGTSNLELRASNLEKGGCYVYSE